MPAGLSWSAQGHLVQRCDQVDLLSNHPQAMHDMVVLTNADHEFTCKTLLQRNGRVRLVPANPAYPDIRPKEGQTIEAWDVATAALTLLRN